MSVELLLPVRAKIDIFGRLGDASLPVNRLALFAAIIAAFVAIETRAAEVIPTKPERYFNDYAGIISKEAGMRFNEQLVQFERETSDQVVVGVFPKMQNDSDLADYTQRVAQSWGVGQKNSRNG